MPGPKSSLLFLFSILTFFILPGCDGTEKTKDQTPPPPVNLDELPAQNPYRGNAAAEREGEGIFGKICSQCHGSDAAGGPEAPDLTDRVALYGTTDRDRFRVVYQGTDKGMPTWGAELGGEKIWKVLAYVDSLKVKAEKMTNQE